MEFSERAFAMAAFRLAPVVLRVLDLEQAPLDFGTARLRGFRWIKQRFDCLPYLLRTPPRIFFP